MPPQIPGINISIIRQATTARRGEPLLISGRVTLLGLGIPTLVRVFLSGPSFDPQITSFDTISAPVSGDYSISVIADKDGRYQVSSQAFPPFVLPIPGGTPITPPPLAESTSPPIVIGDRVNGSVSVDTPAGRQTIAAPAPAPFELFAPITVAPSIPITIDVNGGGGPAFPFIFPGAPLGPTIPDAPELLVITPIIEVPKKEELPVEIEPVISGSIVSLTLE